ncbi:MAG: D-glycerate dehydrogenase [Anaerolineales bacterium]|jgi:lactate dehydrogenase-like 2-hydroxyacid dehydrogenase
MAFKHQVLATHAFPKEWLRPLADYCEVNFLEGHPQEQAGKLLEQAEGILTLLSDKVDASFLARAPRLRVVSNVAVGVDNVDLAECTRRAIPVGSTPTVLTEATADLSMALLLSVARRLPEAAQDARSGRWVGWSATGWLGKDLQGAALGIVGFGQIGQAVARRAYGFGMRLLYADPRPHPEMEAQLQAKRVLLDDLLSESDFVSLHVPLTEETRGLMDTSHFARMKTGAILINTARGAIVNTEALLTALEQGHLGGAGLDVTDPEPLPVGHPLFGLPNCLILPHIGSAAAGARRRMMELACENVLAGLENRPLEHCANPEVYRNPRAKTHHRVT